MSEVLDDDARYAIVEEEDLRNWIAQSYTSATTLAGARIERAILWAGRNDGPDILFAAFDQGLISESDLHELISGVWSDAEFPEEILGQRAWLDLFTLAKLRPAGQGTITAYRGTITRYRRGMSWTTDLEQAKWFAGRWVHFGEPVARVYRARFRPFEILCDVDATAESSGRREFEIVVDPRFVSQIDPVERIADENVEAAMTVVNRRKEERSRALQGTDAA